MITLHGFRCDNKIKSKTYSCHSVGSRVQIELLLERKLCLDGLEGGDGRDDVIVAVDLHVDVRLGGHYGRSLDEADI